MWYLVYIVQEVSATCFKISRECCYLVYIVKEVAAPVLKYSGSGATWLIWSRNWLLTTLFILYRKWLLDILNYPVCVASWFVLSREVAATCFQLSRKCHYLVYIVQEVAALHQQDVVDVGSRGGLVECEPLEPHVPWQVLVQHARS